MVGWKTCCFWTNCWRHGYCKEDWILWIPIRKMFSKNLCCWLWPTLKTKSRKKTRKGNEAWNANQIWDSLRQIQNLSVARIPKKFVREKKEKQIQKTTTVHTDRKKQQPSSPYDNLNCLYIDQFDSTTKETLVFCYQNCSDLLWEKIVLVIEKNFRNSRLRAENLKFFWDHLNNLFKQWKVRTNRILF